MVLHRYWCLFRDDTVAAVVPCVASGGWAGALNVGNTFQVTLKDTS